MPIDTINMNADIYQVLQTLSSTSSSGDSDGYSLLSRNLTALLACSKLAVYIVQPPIEPQLISASVEPEELSQLIPSLKQFLQQYKPKFDNSILNKLHYSAYACDRSNSESACTQLAGWPEITLSNTQPPLSKDKNLLIVIESAEIKGSGVIIAEAPDNTTWQPDSELNLNIFLHLLGLLLARHQKRLLLASEQNASSVNEVNYINHLTEEIERLNKLISESKQAEQTLQQRTRELFSLQSAAAATASSLDMNFVMETVAWEMASLLEVEDCKILGWEIVENQLVNIAEYSSGDTFSEEVDSDALRTYVMSERTAQQISLTAPEIDPVNRLILEESNVQAILALPMIFQDRIVGLVEAISRSKPRYFTGREILLAQMLATHAAIAFENARLFRRAQVEIEQRVEAEKLIKTSLEEKEVLLKEIHHRVKNNLQIISSMLSLQASGVQSAEGLAIFRDSQSRIRSMALIHEKLYRSDNLAQVDIREYIQGLTTELNYSYRSNHPIEFKLDVDAVLLNIAQAVPCGLILNELITNALKHAFPESETQADNNWIHIRIHEDQASELVIIVADNGIGFPEDYDLAQSNTLGIQIISTLVAQLDGSFTSRNNNGAEFNITFPTR